MKNIQQEVIDGNVNPYDLLDLWKEESLSQEDIESLGFELDTDQDGVIEYNGITKSYLYQDRETFTGCCIDFMNNGKIKIFFGDLNSYRSILRFHGTIKNKSELVKMLKQIGCEQN